MHLSFYRRDQLLHLLYIPYLEIVKRSSGLAIFEAEKFFDRVNPTKQQEMDEATSLLYDVCKKMFFEQNFNVVMIEKTVSFHAVRC